MEKQIVRIVCTGGPCSGKTTFMTRAEEIFAERGYRILVDHEAATDLITGGISPATMGMYEFQKYCIGLQLKKEELYDKAAQAISGDRVIIFYDRGILDDKGYVTPDEFTELLKDFNVTEEQCLKQYDLVLHLETSAKGDGTAYTLANNAARYEGLEAAKAVDDTILASWEKHPNRIVIENESDFEVKMRRAIQSVFTFLGQEKPVEVFRKYLVEVNDDLINEMKANANYSHILQHFLASQPGTEKRIRIRSKDGRDLLYYSESIAVAANRRLKKDRIISMKQYSDYSLEIDKTLAPIDKDRYSFYYCNRYFKLDIFSFDTTKALLSVQIPDESEEVEMPPYVNIIKDVTDVINYKNYYLAKNQKF